MHFHPDSVLPLAELEGAAAPRKAEMPVVATCAAGQLALAANDKASLRTFGESFGSAEVQVELEQDGPIVSPPTPAMGGQEGRLSQCPRMTPERVSGVSRFARPAR
jgi:hypothetical protein